MRMTKWLGVEPTMFFYMFAYMLTSVVEEDLIVYKSCRVTHGYPRQTCLNISQQIYQTEKQIVQVTVSWFHMWENIASHAVPAVLALFLGSWSDRVGRKIPLLLGLCGSLIYSMAILINAFMENWRIEWILLMGALPCGLTGGPLAVFMAAFSYLADTTSTESRTFRTTLLEVSYLITMPSGVALGSYLFNKVFNRSHGAMFILNCVCLICSIIYTWLNLEWKTSHCSSQSIQTFSQLKNHMTENQINNYNKSRDKFDGRPSIECEVENPNDTRIYHELHFNKKGEQSKKCRILLLSCLKYVGSHVIDSVKTLTKTRPGNTRKLLYLCLFALALYTFQREEKHSIYLYTQLRFNWDLSVFSSFRMFQSCLYIVGLLVGVPLLNRLFSIRDTVIMMIGALSHISARITFTLANRKSLMYLGGSLGTLGPIVAPVIRSSVSKLVPSYERGKVFALLSVSDMAVPLVSGALYSLVYSQSLTTYPQAVFILTILSQVFVLLAALWMEFLLKGRPIDESSNEIESMQQCVEENRPSETSISLHNQR